MLSCERRAEESARAYDGKLLANVQPMLRTLVDVNDVALRVGVLLLLLFAADYFNRIRWRHVRNVASTGKLSLPCDACGGALLRGRGDCRGGLNATFGRVRSLGLRRGLERVE